MVLKQRANFYNNVRTEIIPCQKRMLLEDAESFEKVCLCVNVLLCEDAESCEKVCLCGCVAAVRMQSLEKVSMDVSLLWLCAVHRA